MLPSVSTRVVEASPAITLTVLGARGSMPVCGRDYVEYGGSTSCYLVQTAGQTVILDAGTGLRNAPNTLEEPTAVLLSHWHLDHVLGLGTYARLSAPNAKTSLFVPAANDDEARRRLDSVFAPPYWPLTLGTYGGDLQVRAMPSVLRLGPMHVTTVQGSHPGGCLVVRIECGGKSIVYVTDYEHDEESFVRLAGFSQGADLLLYDAQYSSEEYDAHRGFGHSTSSKGIELMGLSHAKRLLLVHHDPQSTDEILRERERGLAQEHVRFAREGEVIVL